MPKRSKAIIVRTPEELAQALDLPASVGKEWRVQAELLLALKKITQREKLTHAEIAARAGTSRTRVTAILNGQLTNISSDLLIRILTALGYSVNVSIRRSKRAA